MFVDMVRLNRQGLGASKGLSSSHLSHPSHSSLKIKSVTLMLAAVAFPLEQRRW